LKQSTSFLETIPWAWDPSRLSDNKQQSHGSMFLPTKNKKIPCSTILVVRLSGAFGGQTVELSDNQSWYHPELHLLMRQMFSSCITCLFDANKLQILDGKHERMESSMYSSAQKPYSTDVEAFFRESWKLRV
jgi:hypothetical protein